MKTVLLITALILVFADRKAEAIPTRTSEIHISLFGQPCLLSGPFDAQTLKSIHAISPEQAYPAALSGGEISRVTPAEIKRALERVRKTPANLPASLDRYRELLGKRLDELLPFFDGLESLQKTGNAASLLAAAQGRLSGGAAASFTALVNQPKRESGLADKLFEIYEGAVEPDPQEEFHRAIRRMGVNYACNYE